MSDQNPEDTGVWRPPAAEPSWFTPSKRLPWPDARVWPPVDPEARSTSTVPIPVIEDGPPAAPRQVWPPPSPPAQAPRSAGPMTAAPYGGVPMSAPPGAVPMGDPLHLPEPSLAAKATRQRNRQPMPKAAKVGLQFLGALGLTAALLGAQGYDAIHRYESRNPPAQVQRVSKGQAAPLENATWRLIGIAPAASRLDDVPDRLMLQIELEAIALNDDGKYYTSSLPGFYMTDKAGRTWLALATTTPQELKPGVPGRFALASAVPKELANQVELELWPNEYLAKQRTGKALRFDR